MVIKKGLLLLLMILIFSTPIKVYSQALQTGKLVQEPGTKIEFVRVCGANKHKAYIETSRFVVVDKKGKEFNSTFLDTYLITWSWHYNEKSYYPAISDRLDGFYPKLTVKDINGDGIEEILVKYHTGAHTDVLRIYRQVECTKLELLPGGDIRSALPLIEVTTQKKNGYYVIKAHHRDYSSQGKILYTTYYWDGQKYVGIDNE